MIERAPSRQYGEVAVTGADGISEHTLERRPVQQSGRAREGMAVAALTLGFITLVTPAALRVRAQA